MIGIFDSGLGGLTALKSMRDIAKNEDIVYLGDTARVPYGTRTPETIKRYALESGEFMEKMGVSSLLVACGTVSANALDEMRASFDFNVTGVIEPSSKKAAEVTKNGRVAVIATPATIKSGAFERKIKEIDKGIETFGRACPLFVPLVENGKTSDSEMVRLACEEYLLSVKEFGADTVILGCTHYPIITEAIGRYLNGVTLINSGEEAAREISSKLCNNGEGRTTFYVTDGIESFEQNASLFLGSQVCGKVNIAKL